VPGTVQQTRQLPTQRKLVSPVWLPCGLKLARILKYLFEMKNRVKKIDLSFFLKMSAMGTFPGAPNFRTLLPAFSFSPACRHSVASNAFLLQFVF
jgi:hypothetical protein